MKKLLFPLVVLFTLSLFSCRDEQPGDEQTYINCEDPAHSLEDPIIEWGYTQQIVKPLQLNAAQTHYEAGVVAYYHEDGRLHAYIQYYEEEGQYYGIKKVREYQISCGVGGALHQVPADKFSTCQFNQQTIEKGN